MIEVPSALAEAHNRVNDGPRFGFACNCTGNGPIELDLVEREGLQIAQRGLTRPEVIQYYPYSRRLQFNQREPILVRGLEKAWTQ